MIAQIDVDYIKIRPAKVLSRLVSYALFEGRPVTTKGRWINPLVFQLFNIEKRLPQFKKIRQPVFIVGTGRSGTTILGLILSMHRTVGFLNEPKALWHSIYPKEDVIGSYQKGSARYRLFANDTDSSMEQAAHRLYGAYLKAVCSTRVVDKYPELIFRVPFVKKIFPDAIFLFLVRNGWDTCFSIKRWSERLNVENRKVIHDWWGVNNKKWKLLNEQLVASDADFREIAPEVARFKDHINMAMVEWIVTMREGMRQMRENSDSFLMVRFEDLTHTPRKTLSKILEFCNFPDDRKLFQYADKVISPGKAHPQLKIHPAIHPLLNQTIEELGY